MIEDALYGRRCRLILGLGGEEAIDVTDLRWTFNIEKTMTEDPNKSEITIYNIDNYKDRLQEGMKVILEAGYVGDRYGIIFTGTVLQPLIGYDSNNTDSYVSLIGLDSAEFMNKSSINTTIIKGASSSDIASKCIDDATKEIDKGYFSEELNGNQLSRGKVMFGQPKKFLQQIARTNDMVFYTNNNEVNIIKAIDIPDGEAVELNPTSGLIGRPEQNEEGISGTSLLHPALDINKLIHIDSSYIQEVDNTQGDIKPLPGSGVYKIIKINHVGDSRGDDWYTEFEAIAQPSTTVASPAQQRNYDFG